MCECIFDTTNVKGRHEMTSKGKIMTSLALCNFALAISPST